MRSEALERSQELSDLKGLNAGFESDKTCEILMSGWHLSWGGRSEHYKFTFVNDGLEGGTLCCPDVMICNGVG